MTNLLLFISSDNVELVLGSSAIPESGTASVRARPTVKHYAVSISVKLHGAYTTHIDIYHSDIAITQDVRHSEQTPPRRLSN